MLLSIEICWYTLIIKLNFLACNVVMHLTPRDMFFILGYKSAVSRQISHAAHTCFDLLYN